MKQLKLEGSGSDRTLKKLFKSWFAKYFIENKGWNVKETKKGYMVTTPDGENYSLHRTDLSLENLYNFIKRKTNIDQNTLKNCYKKNKDPFQQ